MGQGFSCGCEDKSESESRSSEREVESSRVDDNSSSVHKKEYDIHLRESSNWDGQYTGLAFEGFGRRFPSSVASNQYSGESYSVRINRGQQSLTYAVNRGVISEVKSQPNDQGNQGLGNHELDNQGSGNQASGGQGTKSRNTGIQRSPVYIRK